MTTGVILQINLQRKVVSSTESPIASLAWSDYKATLTQQSPSFEHLRPIHKRDQNNRVFLSWTYCKNSIQYIHGIIKKATTKSMDWRMRGNIRLLTTC